MMKNHYLAFLTLLVTSSWALGDGIGFKGDRVENCTTTVINVTREQQVVLDTKPKNESKSVVRSISLTLKQRILLQNEAGFGPEKLDVWPLAAAKNTCTCELLNMAIRFKSDMLEVPHFLLGKDMGDRLKSKQDREKEQNFEHPLSPPLQTQKAPRQEISHSR